MDYTEIIIIEKIATFTPLNLDSREVEDDIKEIKKTKMKKAAATAMQACSGTDM